jgi:ribosomal protein S8
MSFTSEISDFISRIKVAQLSKDVTVSLRLCKMTLELSAVFQRHGFIRSFFIVNSKTLIFRLRYKHTQPLIREIKPISTPGHRVF